ncbi:hypothetical protein CANARDRAFT_21517 [[Candida] arabinofermentans NRRL YB-2248]|uniref:Uncharacterized protein n=1 Tax=[Candida] arabinofermentans NRRL YB-2248 TaxID=983967 RepID=A0A1E4T732_9ASCO|nr:hypothetical protein CANARDRAFT_21517 [[Candida] arabinofermentans NRRL YB-2248]
MERLEWSEIGKSSEGKVLSPAYIYNGKVYTAGTVGHFPNDPTKFPNTIEEQTHFALQNFEKTLIASGSNLSSCLKLLIFIKNGHEQKAMNSVYGTYMTTKPARSCVVVKFPNPDILVEIEAVAVQIKGKPKL